MNIKIGNTPMVEIKYKYNNKTKKVYSKLEYYNLTGSIKDRIAYFILNKAIENGSLKPNMTIVEATSGNTGISLSALGAYYKNPVQIFMPDWVSKERVNLMKMYNANVTLVSKKDGGFEKALELAKKFAKENNAFLANQFENENNVIAHYETTAAEILEQLNNNVQGFVSGIGTGGTLIGISKKLKDFSKNVTIAALEPETAPLLSKGEILGDHKIEGIGDDFIPSIVDRKLIDKIFLINDDDAINMSRKISKDLGLGVGISSGANLLASILLNEEINGNVVTVFADDNKKYLSTDLSKDISTNPDFLSNKIELIEFKFI